MIREPRLVKDEEKVGGGGGGGEEEGEKRDETEKESKGEMGDGRKGGMRRRIRQTRGQAGGGRVWI